MPNESCYVYLLEGVGISISEVDEIHFSAKESILMKCGRYISKMLGSEKANRYEAFAVHFHPDVLKEIYKNDLPKFLFETKPNGNTGMVKINSNILINKYIQGFLFYFEHPELVDDDILILKMKEIILLLHQTKDAPAIHKILSSLFSPNSYSLQQIVESHLLTDISIDELSALCNLSLSTFKRAFKLIYNDNPANYLRNKRLEKAAKLLVISDQRINEIAYDCGFNDQAHFSKSFQAKYNCTPSFYRLNQKDKSLN
jgi:AraC-like DNA-binding protein